MNNPQFYIFGVPDGFDMYNATPERINLFQLLYDSDCRDKRKMAIYRNADNSEVSYIYLRYNMQSVKGRPNSFLGMALTFSDRYYCTDIPKLLNLFEEIYSALSKDVILTTRIIPSAGQARYRIGRFAEGTAAIIKIEEFVEEQTRGWFGDCVVQMDETFRLNTQSVSLKQGLYLDTKSEHIIANLKTASWVYLSERAIAPVQNITPPKQPVAQPNSPVTPPSQPSSPLKDSPKPSTVVPSKVGTFIDNADPDVTAKQEHQKKIMRDLAGEFGALHKSISDKQSKDFLQKNRKKLQIIQQGLNNLRYVVGTNEGNSLAIQISSDINRIDEILRKKGNKKKILFATAGVLAVITLLIVFWPKGTQHTKTSFDKEPILSFVEETERYLSEISDTLMNVKDASLQESNNYKESYRLHEITRDNIKQLNDSISHDPVNPTTINNLTTTAESNLDSLETFYRAFLQEKAKVETGARAKAEVEAKAKPEAEAKAKAETEAKTNAVAEAKAKAKAEPDPKKWNLIVKVNGNTINKGSNGKYVVGHSLVTITAYNNREKHDVQWWWADGQVAINTSGVTTNTYISEIRVTLKAGARTGLVKMKAPSGQEFDIKLSE